MLFCKVITSVWFYYSCP